MDKNDNNIPQCGTQRLTKNAKGAIRRVHSKPATRNKPATDPKYNSVKNSKPATSIFSFLI